MRRLVFAGLLALLAAPAHAGVVVLKNGEVLIGRIKAEEDTQDDLVIRWPFDKDPMRTERGEMRIPKFRIRWYDRDADVPNDAYWELHENDPIDNRWLPLLEKWRLRKKQEQELPTDVPIINPFDSPQGKLAPVPVQTKDFIIRKPEGWTSTTEDGITIFVCNTPGADGFRARIHIFSAPAIGGLVDDKINIVKEEFSRLAAEGKFDVKEMKRPKTVRGGTDVEMFTATPRPGRMVWALRQVSFRDKRTYFFTAYADERDYSQHEILFKACMRSLELTEDAKDKDKPAPGAPAPATGTPPPAPATGG
jgi:hypothetical protein